MSTATRIARSAPVAAPAAVPAAAPVRRIGRVSKSNGSAEKQAEREKMIDNHLKLIAINQNRIDYLRASIQPEIDLVNTEIARLTGVLEAELKQAGMEGYTDGAWEAKYVTEITRAARDIDTNKVKAKLGEAEFLQVVKVQVTPLRTFLSEREIDECSSITPAAPGATKFIVQPVEVKGKKTRNGK